MPTFVWILIWAVVLAVVAFLAIRERRAGRRVTADADRMQHEAVREAGVRADIQGPNSSFGGFGN
jgi:hypothetical protein